MSKIISYAHKDDPEGIRFIQLEEVEIPEWAINIVREEEIEEVFTIYDCER